MTTSEIRRFGEEAALPTFRALCLATCLVLSASPLPVLAQGAAASNSALQGTWSLVSIVNELNGSKYEPYGPNPKGQFIFDGTGHYSIIIMQPDLPRFASNDRVKGTPEENNAVVKGSLVHFGTYKVNEKGDGYSLSIDGSTFPNWSGAQQERRFTVTGDQLKIMNPTSSTPGATSTLLLKRMK